MLLQFLQQPKFHIVTESYFKHSVQIDGRSIPGTHKESTSGAHQVSQDRLLEQETSPRPFPGWVGSLGHRQMVAWFLEQETNSLPPKIPHPSARSCLEFFH